MLRRLHDLKAESEKLRKETKEIPKRTVPTPRDRKSRPFANLQDCATVTFKQPVNEASTSSTSNSTTEDSPNTSMKRTNTVLNGDGDTVKEDIVTGHRVDTNMSNNASRSPTKRLKSDTLVKGKFPTMSDLSGEYATRICISENTQNRRLNELSCTRSVDNHRC